VEYKDDTDWIKSWILLEIEGIQVIQPNDLQERLSNVRGRNETILVYRFIDSLIARVGCEPNCSFLMSREIGFLL